MPRLLRRDPGALLVMSFVVSLLGGCTGTTGRLAMVTTRDVDVRVLETPGRPSRHVEGRSCVDVVFVIPIGGAPKFGDAIEAALRDSGSRVLTGVTIRYEVFDIPFIYGKACYVVDADAS